jgi:hypothetical protein
MEATWMRGALNRAGGWERFCRGLYQSVDLRAEARRARAGCRSQLANVGGGMQGDRRAYRAQVLPFWARYGMRPRKMWYDLYCYKNGGYDARYIPEDLYWRRIYPACNRPAFRHAYTDKCFTGQLFPLIKQPRTVVRNSGGVLRDASGAILTPARAEALLAREERFVIKPAIYSGEGADIHFHEKSRAREGGVRDLMRAYGEDYIVQEIAAQHPALASIHPQSLNTIRVISFLFRGEVHISSAILRMGVGGARLDNVSAGGLACPILPDGALGAQAMDRHARWVSRHPGGAVFADLRVPHFDAVIRAVRRAHGEVAHFRILGWDFSIDADGAPVLIEYNGAPGMNQVSCGPLFGALTEPALDMILLGAPEFP